MRITLALVILLLSQLSAHAACVDVPAPGVPRHMRTAVAYALAFAAGHNEVPTDGQGKQPGQSQLHAICFNTFDPTGVITDQAMLDRYNTDEAARVAAANAEATRQATLASEITGNDLCTAELDDIVTRINSEQATIQAQIDATTNVASAKTAMTTMNTRIAAALRKVAKCLKARTDRGVGQ